MDVERNWFFLTGLQKKSQYIPSSVEGRKYFLVDESRSNSFDLYASTRFRLDVLDKRALYEVLLYLSYNEEDTHRRSDHLCPYIEIAYRLKSHGKFFLWPFSLKQRQS